MFQAKAAERLKKHNFCSVTFFRQSCYYEIMWKNIVELVRPQIKIWRMRIACRIPKATNTLSEQAILVTFPLQQWLHERASILRYTYIAFLLGIS
jgi:hypothetical protein